MKTLQKALTSAFRPSAPRKPEPHARKRLRAKKLASEHGIELEKFAEGGLNVWPPRTLASPDPFEEDHYAIDWEAALNMVEEYVRLLTNGNAQA